MTISSLIVDVYPGDKHKDWATYIAAGPPWCGAIFKLCEGLDYEYSDWAMHQRQAFVSSPRYGHDLFDAFYDYLTFHQDGAAQADRAHSLMQKIGGELAGTLPLMIDVERGGQKIANPSPDLVKRTTRDFAERYEELSGRKATLYGGELLRASGVTDLLGCGRSVVALYGPRLGRRNESTADFLKATGTDLEHLMAWQYIAADERTAPPPGYPVVAPGCGEVDTSAVTLPGGLDSLRTLCSKSQTLHQ